MMKKRIILPLLLLLFLGIGYFFSDKNAESAIDLSPQEQESQESLSDDLTQKEDSIQTKPDSKKADSAKTLKMSQDSTQRKKDSRRDSTQDKKDSPHDSAKTHTDSITAHKSSKIPQTQEIPQERQESALESQKNAEIPQESQESSQEAKAILQKAIPPQNKNAFFAGIELGALKFSYDELGAIAAHSPHSPISNYGVNLGVLWGYRHFFSDSIALRGYVNLNYLYAKDKKIAHFSELKILNLGVNADFLLNFWTDNNIDFGGLLGIAIGGDIFAGEGLANIKRYAKSRVYLSSLNTSLNLGVQSLILSKIGIEFIAKIPLMSHYFVNQNSLNKRKLSQNFILSGRILYYF